MKYCNGSTDMYGKPSEFSTEGNGRTDLYGKPTVCSTEGNGISDVYGKQSSVLKVMVFQMCMENRVQY